jgi:hypothetical protein
MVRRLCKAASKSRFSSHLELKLAWNWWQIKCGKTKPIFLGILIRQVPFLLFLLFSPAPFPMVCLAPLFRLASCKFLERVFLDGYVSLGIVESVGLGGKEIETVRNVMSLRESFESTF